MAIPIPKRVNAYPYPQYPQAGKWLSLSNIPKRVNGYPYPQYPQAGKWLSLSPISPSG